VQCFLRNNKMKRANNLWSKIVSFENLYQAYINARKGKQNREAVAQFSFNLEGELLVLQQELITGCYQPGVYRQFIIRERKPRLISAAPFRDRVLHHAVMDVLEPIFEKRFYYHSYACRKNKGVHRAVNQYQQWAKKYNYVLKVDIARYFPSITHDCLKKQLGAIIKDKSVLLLLSKIIDTSPVQTEHGIGLPIGNLTSQYFANLYLNNIDHWLKHELKVPAYLRYVDDLVLLSNSKSELWQIRDNLALALAGIGLKLHSRKQVLQHTSNKIDMFGYQVTANKRWLRNDNGYRFSRKLKKMSINYQQGKLTFEQIKPRVASWIGHAQHGETKALRYSIFKEIIFIKN